MFGYVRVLKPELKIREYEEYKGVYCTLCKTLGKEYGQIVRLSLSYDATFYVLLLTMAQKGAKPCFHNGRCPFNPSKKCHYDENNQELFKSAAALTVILTFHKMKDDLYDGTAKKKALARLLYPLVKRKYKKAKARYPAFATIAEEAMQNQAELEEENTVSTDLAADPSAKALGLLFTFGMQEGTQKEVLYRTAYCIGRFVYLIDAYDDMRDDFKTKSYNPFLLKYTIEEEKKLYTKQIQSAILESLHRTVNEAALSFNLLEGTVHKSILENIFYDGLENQIVSVQKSYEKVMRKNDESL